MKKLIHICLFLFYPYLMLGQDYVQIIPTNLFYEVQEQNCGCSFTQTPPYTEILPQLTINPNTGDISFTMDYCVGGGVL